jgi:hypothetical protein
MYYSVGYNPENKLESPYTLDNWNDFNTIKEVRTFIKFLKDTKQLIGYQYLILKKTRTGITVRYG